MVSPFFGSHWSAQSARPEGTITDVLAPRGTRTGEERRNGERKTTTRLPLRRLSLRRLTRSLHLPVSLDSVEMVLTVVVAALLLVYAGYAVGQHFLHPAAPPVIQVKVQPGTTLWTLADRYGSPDDYILERVDKLATLNNIRPGTHLQPGQVLSVPVENPAERDRLTASAAH